MEKGQFMQRPWDGQGILGTGRGVAHNTVIRGRVKSEEAGQAGDSPIMQSLLSRIINLIK